MKQPIVSISPDVIGGLPRVPRDKSAGADVVDYLEAGESIDDFLAGFPSVARAQVIAFLEEAKTRIVEAADAG